MIHRRFTASVILACATSACGASGPKPASTRSDADPPRTQTAKTQPAETQPATQPAADAAEQWLERIEQKAADISTIRAKLIYIRIQGLLGDEQRRLGTLVYDTGPPPRFAVHFDKQIIDEASHDEDQWYIFDGRWLAERNDQEKVFIRRELVAEDDPDQIMLGEGPFVLPLKPRKDRILERFEVELVDTDEPDTVHLRLKPREHVRIEQDRIDMWFDREPCLLVRVGWANEDETESIIRLRDTDRNPKVDEDVFDTTAPKDPEWQVEIKRLKKIQKSRDD